MKEKKKTKHFYILKYHNIIKEGSNYFISCKIKIKINKIPLKCYHKREKTRTRTKHPDIITPYILYAHSFL